MASSAANSAPILLGRVVGSHVTASLQFADAHSVVERGLHCGLNLFTSVTHQHGALKSVAQEHVRRMLAGEELAVEVVVLPDRQPDVFDALTRHGTKRIRQG